jgi:NAD(P)-dependent dehydrogenase (short-subunit alcohol dehydrogenase family)
MPPSSQRAEPSADAGYEPTDRPLAGKVALVTGASAGLGWELAGVLNRAGARVALAARRAERIGELATQLAGSIAVPCDLTDPGDLADMIGTVASQLGPVDVLVNNAGFIAKGVRAQDETHAEITRTFAVNVVAPMLLSQAVFASMRDRGGGVIVNIGSISGLVGMGRFPQWSYAASKGALHAMTRELAVQWGRYGIRVNVLAPGFFRSELTEELYESPAATEWVNEGLVIRRPGTPQDLGGALVFLASDASSYMTGQVLVVDGGWTAR